MKKQFLIISKVVMAILFMSMTLQSCSSDKSKNKDEAVEENNFENKFSAVINGMPFKAEDTGGIGDLNVNLVTFSGRRIENDLIEITIPSGEIGTYTITSNSNTQVSSTYSKISPWITWNAVSGSVTTTSSTQTNILSKRIKGTFEFTYVNDDPANPEIFEIREGTFDMGVRSKE